MVPEGSRTRFQQEGIKKWNKMEPVGDRTRMQTYDTRIGNSWSHIEAELEWIQMEPDNKVTKWKQN